jgi:hypothetical protein
MLSPALELESRTPVAPFRPLELKALARRCRPTWNAVTIFAVTSAGLVLGLQGWRAHAPAFDMLTYFYGVDAFVERGAVLQYGDISSYGSFSPPGTFWLMLPGRLAFDDARLFEKLGSASLYFGALVGVFLFARAAFGATCARLAVLFYGVSSVGLTDAGSLWPIGHSFFYVWMAYLTTEWATRSDPRYLSAAVGIWALGMYVDMAIAPAVCVLPAAWLLRRPRLWSWTWVAVVALVLLTWYPYLTFEVTRDFVDLHSLVLRQNIAPVDYRAAWCDPSLSLGTAEGTVVDAPSARDGESPRSIADRLLNRGGNVLDGLLSNFRQAVHASLGSAMLLLAVLSCLLLVAIRGKRRARLSLITLIVPWAILVILAEPGKPERFLWLWPVQALLIAAFCTEVVARRMPYKALVWSVQISAILLIVGAPIRERMGSWLEVGWSGVDAPEVQVVDFAASQLDEDNRDHVAIGYQTFVYPFMARYHAIDSHYKVGADFDLLFKSRHDITNLDQCAEGLSPADDLRIVQDRPKLHDEPPAAFFEVSSDGQFTPLGRVGDYHVVGRE